MKDAALIRSLQGDGYQRSLLAAVEGLSAMAKAGMFLEATVASDLIVNDDNDQQRRAELLEILQSIFSDRSKIALCKTLLAEGLTRAEQIQAQLNAALEICSDDALERLLELIETQQSRSTLTRIFNSSPDLGGTNA